MRITLSKGAAVGAAALLGVTVLAGCSSSDSSSEETTTSETTSEEAGGSMDGGSQMLPPVIVEPGQTEASAKVGDFIDIIVEEIVGTTIATDNPEILKVSQAYDDGSAVFNPGAEALAPGTAIITVTTPDNTTYDITVTVTE